VIDARREIADLARPDVVNPYERVIVAIAGEGELRPIGRPARPAVRAPCDEWFLPAVDRRHLRRRDTRAL
jgi:hypothetical protein